MIWNDLPERLNVFTVRNAAMVDLNTKEVVQWYSANTHLVMVQSAQYKGHTFYRTASATEKGLDWAFKASAFGLPDDVASSANYTTNTSQNSIRPGSRNLDRQKQKFIGNKVAAKDEGLRRTKKSLAGFFKYLFKR